MASYLVRVCCLLACATALADEGGPVVWGRRGRTRLHCPEGSARPSGGEARRTPPHFPLVADGGGAGGGGGARPDVSWRRDGELLAASGGWLKAERPGTYRCGVRSPAGLVLGAEQTVQFASLDKRFSEEPADTLAPAGQPAALRCRVRSAPPANVTWWRDGRALPADTRHFVLDSGDLLILDVAEEDAGNYSCVATNGFVNKTRASRSASLAVARDAPAPAAPGFLLPAAARPLRLRAGSELLLPCPVLGVPPPHVEWQFSARGGGGGGEGDGGATQLDAPPVLRIERADVAHAGVYTCSVRGQPQLNQSWEVTVLQPARITQAPESIHKPSAGVVRLDCAAAGRPEPALTWYKNGAPLAPGGRVKLRKSSSGNSTRVQLVISGAQPSDAGVYQCFAQSAGTAAASAWAVLGVAGGALLGPAAVRCRPRGPGLLHLDWRPVSTPSATAATAAPHHDKPALGIYYTVSYVQTEGCAGRCEEQIKVDPESPSTPRMEVPVSPLVPYQLSVRAYFGKDASEPSHRILCRGQGVPVQVSAEEGGVRVRWGSAAARLPHVTRWRLQHRPRGGDTDNVTLDGATLAYLLPGVTSSDDHEVRLLATTTEDFPPQDLSELPWTSTRDALAASAQQSSSGGGERAAGAVPSGLAASGAWVRGVRVSWRCDACESSAGAYSFVLCYKRYDPLLTGKETCINSDTNEVEVGSLEPGTQYEFRAQALLQRGRGAAAGAAAGGGAFSDTLLASTLHDESRKIKKVNYSYLDGDGLLVWWSVAEGEPADNTSATYTVHYSQNLTRPLYQWRQLVTSDTRIELWGLDRQLKTYVIVSSRSHGQEEHGPVVEVPPRAAAFQHYTLLGIIAGAVVVATCLLCCGVLCVWRRRKRARARTQHPAPNAEENGTEMMSGSGRLVNGKRRGADEPLLNGYACPAETRLGKTSNGRYKASSAAATATALDMSRDTDTDADATLDTILEADDVSEVSGGARYPDDNMNSQLRRGEGGAGGAGALQPNG